MIGEGAGVLQAAEKLVGPVIPRSPRRRGISHCLENTQSEIPRSARNDSLEGFFRSLFFPPWRGSLIRRFFSPPSLPLNAERRISQGTAQLQDRHGMRRKSVGKRKAFDADRLLPDVDVFRTAERVRGDLAFAIQLEDA